MKKLTYIIIAIIFLFALPGCSVTDIGETTEFDPHTTWDYSDYCKPMLDEVIKCLDEKDTETLKNMFSEYVTENYDLDEEIKNAMDAYNGKMVSCEKFFCDNGGYSIQDGYFSYRCCSVEYECVSMDSGEEYNIVVKICFVDDEYPERIGVTGIDIRDNNYEYDLEHTNNRIARIGSSL